jgi:hypothetical protein
MKHKSEEEEATRIFSVCGVVAFSVTWLAQQSGRINEKETLLSGVEKKSLLSDI